MRTGYEGIELNKYGSGNRYAYLDLYGIDGTNYSLRLIKNNDGLNGNAELIQAGSGVFAINMKDAGSMQFQISSSPRLNISNTGNMVFTVPTGQKFEFVVS